MSGGELIEEQIPLTAEDLLDPQLGDVVFHHFGVPRDLERSSFDAVQEGARPSLILELVSSIDAERL